MRPSWRIDITERKPQIASSGTVASIIQPKLAHRRAR
jgi:hypothetical protein